MNKVLLIGTVDKEPDVRYVDVGVCVASLTLCTTDRGATLPDGTQLADHNEWHRVVCWRKLGEVVEQQVHQGQKLYVEGKLHHRSYVDKSGATRYVVEIWADSLELL